MSEQRPLPQSIEEIDALLQMVYQKIGAPNTSEIEAQVQHELSKSVVLLQRIKRYLIRAHYRQHHIHVAQLESIIIGLHSAIAVLLVKPYELHFAQRLRRDAEFAVREYQNPVGGVIVNTFKYVLYESSTAVKVFAGLALSLPIALALGMSARVVDYSGMISHLVVEPLISRECAITEQASPTCEAVVKAQVNENLALLASVTLAGALGGITSTLIRIREFENERYTDTVLPVYIGLIRPFIGGAFGILVFVVLSSKLLPLQVSDSDESALNKWYGFVAIAFVAGFSERLVKDMISQTEKRFLPGLPPAPTAPKIVPPMAVEHEQESMQVEYSKRSSTQVADASVVEKLEPTI